MGIGEVQDSSRETGARSSARAPLDPRCMGTRDQQGMGEHKGRGDIKTHLILKGQAFNLCPPSLPPPAPFKIAFSLTDPRQAPKINYNWQTFLTFLGPVLPFGFKIRKVRRKIKLCHFSSFSDPRRGLVTLRHKPRPWTSSSLSGLASSVVIFEGGTINPSQGMEKTLSRNAGKERGI